MTEDEARSWLVARNVPRETFDAIERFIAFLRIQSTAQNLIAASTLDAIWARHIVDSAQLLDLAPDWNTWLDLGSGAGFPGLIVALLSEGRKVTLVESRAKRIAFLQGAALTAGIVDRVEIIGSALEKMKPRRFDVISARAFAPLDKLLTLATPFADKTTRWVLPKGRRAAEELEATHGSWQGVFELVPSVTDSEAAIIVATDVTPRKR
ncbi:16S rRNA (guanine(527)-N(7))-methyltransferase RsmG [Sphingomonas crusticola]|uniref:16S rRNA (guanine(527)-N(7))-methyltransferase RsmG n=1 Tax=Sphingomonas crusticola TaxID=1697973 RepID=UPI000E2837AF|nr:16S rRNA (guanine(527)-N(7))-methyltransferase RsmG [Sphingomonas crusticola]